MKLPNKPYTPTKAFWRKFRKNPLAIGGMVLISIYLVLSIMGYLITPDSSPFANRQVVEIATQEPGFRTQFLKVRKNKGVEQVSWIKKMLSGQPESYEYIPINNFTLNDSTIVVESFSPHPLETPFYASYSLADVVYAQQEYHKKADSINITLINNEHIAVQTDKLQEKVKAQIVEKSFLLGTDRFGRDLLSRLIIGSRISLSVGFISVLISVIIGIFLGATAGYFGGKVDKLIMWLVNVVWSIPTLLLVIAVTLVLGKGFWQIFVAVGLTMWVEVARVVRGQVLSIREKEYIEAARALGMSHFRIIFNHILPNAINPVIIISAANFATAILLEAGLSFLGIGVQPPIPSWGAMIKQHYGFIIMEQAYLALLPGFAILSMVLAFTWIGNGLRDALDYKAS
jgi:peptide/nickel transport system permease protein